MLFGGRPPYPRLKARVVGRFATFPAGLLLSGGRPPVPPGVPLGLRPSCLAARPWVCWGRCWSEAAHAGCCSPVFDRLAAARDAFRGAIPVPPVEGPRGRSLRDLPRGLVAFGSDPLSLRCAACAARASRSAHGGDRARGLEEVDRSAPCAGASPDGARGCSALPSTEGGPGRGDAVPCGGWVCRTGAPSVTGEVAIPCGGAADAPPAYFEGPRGGKGREGNDGTEEEQIFLFQLARNKGEEGLSVM